MWTLQSQCWKLRVHPTPGVHNLTAGCTHHFIVCASGRCTIFANLIYNDNLMCTHLYGRVYGFTMPTIVFKHSMFLFECMKIPTYTTSFTDIQTDILRQKKHRITCVCKLCHMLKIRQKLLLGHYILEGLMRG